ncbi:MAG: MotA/TolQ/ExbB proton channel family protein [Bdellovibrionales bacterium]|nr:MotA/TolQ/ExbB proton channel family protein [Bdellovibrionales bacterium]
MDSFWHIFRESPFMWINAVVSVGAVGLILWRFLRLKFFYDVDAKRFLQNIEKHVLANDLTQAINHCNTSNAPLAKVVKSGLIRANQGHMAISMGLDESLLEVSPKVEKGVGALWSLANIATLVGLIGTIFGLIRSFSGLSVATPEQRAKLLGAGIAEALYNTALGLTIAVICIIAHLVLSGLAKGILADVDYGSSKVENLLHLRKDSPAKG